MRAFVNAAADPAAVPAPVLDAIAFHERIDDYEPTPVRELDAVARELGIEAVRLKDESRRLGLPSFKVLGASWAVERALRAWPDTHTLVTASAGNHGRAVAFAARRRGLGCRVFLPERSAVARREAIAAEGAEVVVVEGTYEDAVARARAEAEAAGVVELADVGSSGPPEWVVDGYATLFEEAARQADFDLLLVPVGVGSLATAAARFAAAREIAVVGVEPAMAACLTASLAAGRPVSVDTPGTTMAGLDCAEVSPFAWPNLRAGIAGTVTVADEKAHAAVRELAGAGLEIGESGAAPLAALRVLAREPDGAPLREAVGFCAGTRALLIATEGATDPENYSRVVTDAPPHSA